MRSRRSRAGCSNCRRQRIKCDEDYPQCQQCKKKDRHCNLAEARFRNYAPPGGSGHDAPLSPPQVADAAQNGEDDAARPLQAKRRCFRILGVDTDSERQPERSSLREENTAQSLSSQAVLSSPEQTSSVQLSSHQDHRPRSHESLSQATIFPVPSPELTGHASARSEVTRSNGTVGADNSSSSIERGLGRPLSEILNPITQLPPLHETLLQATADGDTFNRGEGARSVGDEQLHPILSPAGGTHYDVSIRHGVETAQERAFLLRYFAVRPGKWMDLFDVDRFYSRDVPVLALHSPILMFSACAFAARQLSMTSGQPLLDACRSYDEHRMTSISRKRDWTWIAESYYDAAISLLRKHTSDVAAQDNGDLDESRFAGGMDQEAGAPQDALPGAKLRDQVVAAVIILANYEFLKGVAPNWSDHLDGTRSFLRLCDEAGFLAFGPSSPLSGTTTGPPRLLRAAFWNFARQDMLSALIHKQRTRLEMEDIAMWRRMGVNLGDDGRLNGETSALATQHWTDRIDMVSNTMIWLLAKLVNFINTISVLGDDAVDGDANENFTASDSRHRFVMDSWLSLRDELQIWHEARPLLFQPCSRVPLVNAPRRRTESFSSATTSASNACRCKSRPVIDHETWYSESMCASTMQSYHMVQIFLLLHKPSGVSVHRLHRALGLPTSRKATSDALSEFTLMRDMLNHHAAEICAIALSRPDEAARIHMLQPLYMAGRCLEDVADRRTVVRLIDGIEDELGWHAKYRVEALLEEWDMTREMLGCHCVDE